MQCSQVNGALRVDWWTLILNPFASHPRSNFMRQRRLSRQKNSRIVDAEESTCSWQSDIYAYAALTLHLYIWCCGTIQQTAAYVRMSMRYSLENATHRNSSPKEVGVRPEHYPYAHTLQGLSYVCVTVMSVQMRFHGLHKRQSKFQANRGWRLSEVFHLCYQPWVP